MEMCLTESDFLEKSPSSENDQKWSKMPQKWGFWTV